MLHEDEVKYKVDKEKNDSEIKFGAIQSTLIPMTGSGFLFELKRYKKIDFDRPPSLMSIDVFASVCVAWLMAQLFSIYHNKDIINL